jgi:hypothetical protein
MFRPDIVYEDDHDLVIQAQDGYRWTWDTPDADPPKGEAFVPEDGRQPITSASCGREGHRRVHTHPDSVHIRPP